MLLLGLEDLVSPTNGFYGFIINLMYPLLEMSKSNPHIIGRSHIYLTQKKVCFATPLLAYITNLSIRHINLGGQAR